MLKGRLRRGASPRGFFLLVGATSSQRQYRQGRLPLKAALQTCTVAAHSGSAFAGLRYFSVAARCWACRLFSALRKRSYGRCVVIV